ncbi:MAG: septum formation protein Maf [Candidatus Lokiarchaeota archaeon]|nr:septum formation protein Maf [Candidatus Lokiarchaeota archaeon]
MKKIILASQSKDRKKLLESIGLEFDILPTDIEENKYKESISEPIKLACELAKAKALRTKENQSLSKFKQKFIIIAADTIVEFEGNIIGKARDPDDAFRILNKLSGKSHNLITGIAITETLSSKLKVAYDCTKVKFLPLSDEEIRGYLKSGEWRGRAGAYSIREKAGLFVESIEGSISNVVGLPLQKLFQTLKEHFNTNILLK